VLDKIDVDGGSGEKSATQDGDKFNNSDHIHSFFYA
jgi:hypothetical protein